MTAPKEHECKQKTVLGIITAMIALFFAMGCYAVTLAATAADAASAHSAAINANTKALSKLDGNDRRIAEIQRDIAWIVTIMKQEREEREDSHK